MNGKSIYIYAIVVVVAVTSVIAMVSMHQGITNEAKAEYDANTDVNTIVREVTVIGLASKSVRPDKVTLAFSVETEDAKISNAIKKNAMNVSNVIEVLKSLGISDEQMSTSRYSVNPVYSQDQVGDITCSHYYPPREECLIGYRATYILTISMDAGTDIGRVIDAVAESDVIRITGIGYSLSEELRKSVREELMSKAVEDAKNNAEKLLIPLGESVGKVKNIRHSYYYEPFHLTPNFAPVYAGQATQIYLESQQINVSVEVTFLIEGRGQ
jgi:uncharacterized protein YggE